MNININKEVYNKFDLSSQAIIIPNREISCLYFEFWGSDFVEIFNDFFRTLNSDEILYFSDAYNSNNMDRHFNMINIEKFIYFINSKNYSINIDGQKYNYNSIPYSGGMIIIHHNLNWAIHRDPDFGTITFAYDNNISQATIKLLKENKYFVSDSPKQSFYTDEG